MVALEWVHSFISDIETQEEFKKSYDDLLDWIVTKIQGVPLM